MIKYLKVFLALSMLLPALGACEDYDHLVKFKLPKSIDTLVAEFGKPDEVILPEIDDPSPWGQWFKWTLKEETIFTALADDYTRKPNFKAEVRYVDIRIRPVEFSEQNNLTTSNLHKRSELGLDKSVNKSLKNIINGEFIYYFINDSGKLAAIGKSTFDMDVAD